jgi:small conductance mechanosensitive channel
MTEEPQPLTFILEQLIVDFLTLLPSLIAALVVFVVGLFLASIIRRVVRRALMRRTENTQPITLLSQLAYWLVVILVAAISLQMVGFNLTAFLAGLGIAGITIGFALQDVSKNFIAGLLMLIQQPFEIGESIEVGGYSGTVEAIDPITNFSQAETRRVEISTGVAYESDPETVRQIAVEAISTVPGIQSEPAPSLFFQNFGSSTLDLTIYFWISTNETGVAAAKDAGLNAIKGAFDEKLIDMPNPAQTVYLVQEPAA